MLVGSGRRIFSNPITYSNGAVQSQSVPMSGSVQRNMYYGYAGFSPYEGLPTTGVNGSYAQMMPFKAGRIACRSNGNDGTSDFTAAGAMGVNGEATIADAIAALTASLALVSSGEAAITGSGSIDSAALVALLNATAAIDSAASISALIDALAFAVSTINGIASNSTTLTANGTLNADILPFTELSPQSLANAVWTSTTSSYTEAGTMGKAMSDAGGAGNPWASPVTGNTTAGSFGALVNDISIDQLTMSSDIAALEALVTAIQTKIDELHAIEGLDALNPMTVTPTSRASGTISLTITGDGVTTNTVTRV